MKFQLESSLLLALFMGALLSRPGSAAERISLLEEARSVFCEPKEKFAGLTSVRISAKDTEIEILSGSSLKKFRTQRFLNSAILATVDNGDPNGIWFHIRENGEPLIVLGEVDGFRESNCRDKLGTKNCSTIGKREIEWSTERLWIKSADQILDANVFRYGVLGNRATYFLSDNSVSQANVRQGVVLADYGEELQLVIGTMVELVCRFSSP